MDSETQTPPDSDTVAYAKRGTKRRMTAAEDAPAVEPTWPAETALPDGFTPIGDPPSPHDTLAAPWNGKPVMLVGGTLGQTDTGYWRWTREFRNGAWIAKGLWAKWLTAGSPLGFEPIGWRAVHD